MLQVYQEARRFCKVYNIATVCAYGGGSKWEQQNALKEGAELVVCTPVSYASCCEFCLCHF